MPVGVYNDLRAYYCCLKWLLFHRRYSMMIHASIFSLLISSRSYERPTVGRVGMMEETLALLLTIDYDYQSYFFLLLVLLLSLFLLRLLAVLVDFAVLGMSVKDPVVVRLLLLLPILDYHLLWFCS